MSVHVLSSRGSLTKRRVVSHAEAGREEDLATSLLPNVARRELVAVPLGPVDAQAIDGVWQRARSADENDHKDEGQTHGKVHYAAHEADAAKPARGSVAVATGRGQTYMHSHTTNHVKKDQRVVSMRTDVYGYSTPLMRPLAVSGSSNSASTRSGLIWTRS